MTSVILRYICRVKAQTFHDISWYSSIPVLKSSIRNTVFYSVTERKPVYFSKVRWIDMRSRRQI